MTHGPAHTPRTRHLYPAHHVLGGAPRRHPARCTTWLDDQSGDGGHVRAQHPDAGGDWAPRYARRAQRGAGAEPCSGSCRMTPKEMDATVASTQEILDRDYPHLEWRV